MFQIFTNPSLVEAISQVSIPYDTTINNENDNIKQNDKYDSFPFFYDNTLFATHIATFIKEDFMRPTYNLHRAVCDFFGANSKEAHITADIYKKQIDAPKHGPIGIKDAYFGLKQ